MINLKAVFVSLLMLCCITLHAQLDKNYQGVNASKDPRVMKPDVNQKIPYAPTKSLFMEEMNWLEIRDEIKSGKTTAIILTGGLEMSGPYLVSGKHNIVCRMLGERIADQLGNALVATVVPYVPEGDFEPVSGHMFFPGSIGVRQETFEMLLEDIANSLRVTGFKNIILMGDSGGNVTGMAAVTKKLNQEWNHDTNIYHVSEFYDNNRLNQWVFDQGILEISEGHHESYRYEAMMMLVDPETIRAKARMEKGLFSINNIPLAPVEKTLEIAEKMAKYHVDFTVEAIEKAIGK